MEPQLNTMCVCLVPQGFFICTVCLKGIDLARHVEVKEKKHAGIRNRINERSED